MSKREIYRLGMAAYHAGRYEQAIKLLASLVSDGGETLTMLSKFYLGQAHYRLAIRLFSEQRFSDAERHFQKATTMNASGGGFAKYLAACYLGTGRYDLAARELESMLRREPENVDLRVRLALAYYRQGHPIDAMTVLREGLCQQPREARLHYQLGVMLAAEEDFTDAERSFERAVAYNPSHAEAYERLAQICSVHGRYTRALEYLEKAHKLDPLNARLALQLSLVGQSEIKTGHRTALAWQVPSGASAPDESALKRLGQAIADEPDFVETFLSLPESEVDGEVFSTLAATIERALRNHPEYADLHYHCGAVYRRLGRRRDAIEHTERAVQINPRYTNALIQLAELYGQTDQWAKGVERLEQAIRLGADYPDVHCLIGRLCQAGGQLDRARKAYKRALDLNQNDRVAREALEALAV